MKKTTFVLILIILLATFLRLYKLNSNPPSLYWDEVSLGYNAFGILTEGTDEHGERFPLARFIAFGDYKPPGYIYSIVPFMAAFGVNEWSVRLPSALSGIAMVFVTYLLTKKITQNEYISLVASFLLTISPWSLQLSRAAFEAHLAALFSVLGIYTFLKIKDRGWWIIVSVIFFVLAFYTFNANRILSPLLLIFLSVLHLRHLLKEIRWFIIGVLIGTLLLLPSVSYLQSRESRLRFHEVTIFTSLDIVKKANERIERSGNTWWAKLIHNRRVYFAQEFLHHYIDHFKGHYLFIKGDANPRLSIQDVGQLYVFELPLIILGLYWFFRTRKKESLLLIGWMLIAPIPAATARETPHMLRTASMLPTFQIFAAAGGYLLWNLLLSRKKVVFWSICTVFLLISLGNMYYYFHNYWVHYPKTWSQDWQYGYKELVKKTNQYENQYDSIWVTQSLGRPYIYFLFYNQIRPSEYLSTRIAERDWYGLWNVYGFGKYSFSETPPNHERMLMVKTKGSINPAKKIDEVVDLNGDVVFEIGTP